MNKHMTWHDRAKDLTFQTKAFIGGKLVDAASGKAFDSFNPATNARIATVATGPQQAIGAAVLELEAGADAGHTGRELDARHVGHACRIEEDRAGVVGNCRRTGIGGAQAAGVLFPELEGGCRS